MISRNVKRLAAVLAAVFLLPAVAWSAKINLELLNQHQDELLEYSEKVTAQMNRHVYQKYDGKGQGTIALIVTFGQDGSVLRVDVAEKSAGFRDELAAKTVEWIKEAAPVAPFPSNIKAAAEELKFRLQYDFNRLNSYYDELGNMKYRQRVLLLQQKQMKTDTGPKE